MSPRPQVRTNYLFFSKFYFGLTSVKLLLFLPLEVSHIRGPVGLPSTVQSLNQSPHTQNQQHLTKEGSTRAFHQTKANTGDRNPTTGETKFTHLQPYPESLEGSELITQSWLSCGAEQGPDRASVHEGIFRGITLNVYTRSSNAVLYTALQSDE